MTPFLCVGEVVDRADPEGLGRVKVRIAGIAEPSTDWAFPLGTLFGGTAQRGAFAPPPLKAAVGVLFNQGDVDHPFYISGFWGKPRGISEVPTDAVVTPNGDNKVIETDHWRIELDDRAGSHRLNLKHKTGTSQVLLDESDGKVTVKATTVVVDAGTIELGSGAGEKVALGDSLKALVNANKSIFDAHIHPTPAGPSSPTATPMTAMTDMQLSSVAKVKA